MNEERIKYPPVELGRIVDIEETASHRRARQLLAAGFQLLAVIGTAYESDRRVTPADGGGQNAPSTYIRHNVCYVIGRANGWPEFPPGLPREDRRPLERAALDPQP